MHILAVDDEKIALEELQKQIEEAVPDCTVHAFTKPQDALELIRNTVCQVAFLDIRMRGKTGIELASELKDITPNINIIFATGYSNYTFDAINLRASGYLMKPVTVEEIQQEMNNLRNPIFTKSTRPIRVQTFGNFEIFYEEKAVHFSRSRSKELLAYLVDLRGTSATYPEVAGILWEDGVYDRARQKQMNNYIHDIKTIFRKFQVEDILINDRKSMHVNIQAFDCDYYEFLEGNIPVINSYTGKYMSAYSWAEMTIAYLDTQKT